MSDKDQVPDNGDIVDLDQQTASVVTPEIPAKTKRGGWPKGRKRGTKSEERPAPLPGQSSFLPPEDSGGYEPLPSDSGESDESDLGASDDAQVASAEIRPDFKRTPKEKTIVTGSASEMLSMARRVKEYKSEVVPLGRQMDFTLKGSVLTGIYFQTWANPADDYPVAVIRPKNDSDRKEVYILHPDVAELEHVKPHVLDGTLRLVITVSGTIYVWVIIEADPLGNKMAWTHYQNMLRVEGISRRGWVLVEWGSKTDANSSGQKMTIYEPTPEEKAIFQPPMWYRLGQPITEAYWAAIQPHFITDRNHAELRRYRRQEIK
jgi:hypothetical protein